MMISPNDLHHAACRLMLDGRQPETPRDWQLVVNCWASNVAKGPEVEICRLMALLYDCPLSDDIVTLIALRQQSLKS